MGQEAYDPLADAPPPRYAVESDDEDEHGPSSARLPGGSEQQPEVRIEFKYIYNIPSRRPLIFASGEAGLNWAKIVSLDEQQGGIYVNDLQVGQLFRPPWTAAIIIVSEAETHARLPRFAMTAYSMAIISRLQPTSVAMLDYYPTKLYVSPRPISEDSTPIRYISVGNKPVPDFELELFAPPNLLQSTTASLLNELFMRSINEDSDRSTTAVILLPSSRVPPPPPTLFDGRGATWEFAESSWTRETLEDVHRWLFSIIGEDGSNSGLRTRVESAVPSRISVGVARSGLGKIGEGSMYI